MLGSVKNKEDHKLESNLDNIAKKKKKKRDGVARGVAGDVALSSKTPV
jgi:hypothetical protein